MDRATAQQQANLRLYDQLVEVSGGYTPLAKRLGWPLTTLHGYKRRKKVPHWRIEAMRELAAIDGLTKPKRGARHKKVA